MTRTALLQKAGSIAAHLHELTGADYRIASLVMDMHIAAARGEFLTEAAMGGWRYRYEAGQ